MADIIHQPIYLEETTQYPMARMMGGSRSQLHIMFERALLPPSRY
jgi:hypothetical protein